MDFELSEDPRAVRDAARRMALYACYVLQDNSAWRA
jgi:hypothetical protein